ncbi:MAG TPA: Hsp70 family protein [Glycomyces sp.]|nr:Hsp70 family protein [Glycomyces sp.]
MSRLSPRPALVSIDFGTSHTVASIRRLDGRVQQQLFDGSPQLPSAVYLNAAEEIEVGVDAVHHGRRHPERSEPHPKRRVDDGTMLLGERELPVADVIAAVLERVKREIRQATGAMGPVTMTVPATWGPTRKHVVTDAAAQAGLGDLTLVAEPVAAATYFVATLGNDVPTGSGVVVYDLGGGTFDATVLRRGPAGFEVLSVDGADDLGGIDFDHALAAHLAANVQSDDERWRRLTAPETTADGRHRMALLEEVRHAKERLSRQSSTELTIPLLDVDAHLTRDELEAVARPLLERTVRITQGVIRESGLGPEGLAGLFLVGAASRMPLAGTLLHQAIGLAPASIEQPELAVSEGGLNAAAVATPPAGPVTSPAMSPVMTHVPSPTQHWQHTPAALPPQTAGPTAPMPVTAPLPPAPPPRSFGSWIGSARGVITSLAVLIAVAMVVATVVYLDRERGADPGDADPAIAGEEADTEEDRPETGDEESEEAVDPADYYVEQYGEFEEFTESGGGDAVVELPEGVTAGIVEASFTAANNLSMFTIESLDEDNQASYDLHAYSFGGSTEFSAPFGVGGLGATAKLSISADSDWTLTIKPVSSAPLLEDSVSGTDSHVLLYNGEAAEWDLEYTGNMSFSVTQIASDGLLGSTSWASKAGTYTGTAAGQAGPSVIIVTADGDWSITKR